MLGPLDIGKKLEFLADTWKSSEPYFRQWFPAEHRIFPATVFLGQESWRDVPRNYMMNALAVRLSRPRSPD